jgi:prepilin-type N-terminal cleavage/methylation domain-containing protein
MKTIVSRDLPCRFPRSMGILPMIFPLEGEARRAACPTPGSPRFALQRFAGRTAGYTLVEILVVLAIVGALMALSIPAVMNVSKGQKMGRAVEDISDLLEYAKTEAQARKTYVWVGFKNLPASSKENPTPNHQIAAAAFFSTDGTTNAGGDKNLRPLSQLVRVDSVKLVRGSWQTSDLSPAMQKLLDDVGYTAGLRSPDPVGVSDNTDNKQLPDIDNVDFDRTLTFTPQGEALRASKPTATDGFDFVIDLGLKRMRGDLPDAASPDDAALWLYGATGRVREWRLK